MICTPNFPLPKIKNKKQKQKPQKTKREVKYETNKK